ncbi:B12-binding domain-containing radical SAM protein [Prosthecochloris sp. GSB1]|uniref:B12-binding domain-containing radical SAM protein n=1 Tax=Prosthecochloris sp. GSB1 TaxID=281093 RepID=UPI000B8CC684|nr:B12-binding domain-containing radical SAM protein [Prosthecochloris sp. GSB1]ASQ91605.1 B12-binding domain-containing radical SAM protein [Prosthecochloris sp. GSB1]
MKSVDDAALERLASRQKSRKKWLLVQPVSNTSMMVDSGRVSMPLNLLMVATLAGELFDVNLVDERLGDSIPEDFSGYDVIAITSRTLNARKAYAIADMARSQGKIVLLGGVHPTMLQDEALTHATSIVYGEIESVWTELASDVMRGRMKSVYRSESLKPMSAMKRADFSYALRSRNAKRYSSRIPVLATKGCPVGCNFCTTPTIYGKNYRFREIDLVLDEMRYHQDRLDRDKVHFSFMDDNISFRPAYFTALLEKMAKLDVRWNANISMNFLHKPEIAELAAWSGCDLMSIGFESLNPETLKSVHKGSNRLDNYETVVSNLHRNGIAIQGYFMFGFDNDSEESFQLTYDFIMDNQIEFPVFSLVTPFPGTPYFEEMKPRLRHFDWDKYDTYHFMFEPRGMRSGKFLEHFVRLQKEIYKGRSIMRRMQGKPLNWVWLANFQMNRFTRRLRPEMYL